MLLPLSLLCVQAQGMRMRMFGAARTRMVPRRPPLRLHPHESRRSRSLHQASTTVAPVSEQPVEEGAPSPELLDWRAQWCGRAPWVLKLSIELAVLYASVEHVQTALRGALLAMR